MKLAYDHGVNYFDTAESYDGGESERVLGEAIRRFAWPRASFVVSTKVYWGVQADDPNPNAHGLSRKHILEGVRGSLDRLGLAYVDVLLAHKYDAHTPMEEIVRAFNHVIDQGWALYWGTSGWTVPAIVEARAVADRLGLVAPIVEQPGYNMLLRDQVESEYVPLYEDRGLGLTTFYALDQGILTGKYLDGFPEGARFGQPGFQKVRDSWTEGNGRARWETTCNKVRQLQTVAEELQVSLAVLAVAWCLGNERVSSVILGIRTPEQLRENLRAVETVEKLTPDVTERINSILTHDTYTTRSKS